MADGDGEEQEDRRDLDQHHDGVELGADLGASGEEQAERGDDDKRRQVHDAPRRLPGPVQQILRQAGAEQRL